MTGGGRTVAAAALAAALLVATRVPRDGLVLQLVVVAGGAAMVAFAALRTAWPRWSGPGLAAAALAAFAVPPSTQAWGAALPAAVPVLVLLVFLDFAYEHAEATAPWAGQRPPRSRTVLKYAPFALLTALLLALPSLLRQALPIRMADAYEWTGPAGPLVAGALLAGPLLAAAWLREAWSRRPAPREPDKAEEAL